MISIKCTSIKKFGYFTREFSAVQILINYIISTTNVNLHQVWYIEYLIFLNKAN